MATMKADNAIANFVTIVENAAGRGDYLYEAMDESLKEIALPHVKWGMGEVGVGGFMSKTREFMIITNDTLREYTIFLFARDIGKHLDCGWFMTVTPGMFKKAFSRKVMGGDPLALSQSLDIFAQEDLSAWQAIVHRTFRNHVKALMQELKQDITELNTQSKGFLSVW